MKKKFLFLLPLLLLTLLVACTPNLKKEKKQALEFVDSFRDTLEYDLNVTILYRDPTLSDVKYRFLSQKDNILSSVKFIYPDLGYDLSFLVSGEDYHSKTKVYYNDIEEEKYEESKMSHTNFRTNYYYDLFNLNNLNFENAEYDQTPLANKNFLNTFSFDEKTSLIINYTEYKLNLTDINISFETTFDQDTVDLVILKAYDSITKNYIEILISNYWQ